MLLSKVTLQALRVYWRQVRNSTISCPLTMNPIDYFLDVLCSSVYVLHGMANDCDLMVSFLC